MVEIIKCALKKMPIFTIQENPPIRTENSASNFRALDFYEKNDTLGKSHIFFLKLTPCECLKFCRFFHELRLQTFFAMLIKPPLPFIEGRYVSLPPPQYKGGTYTLNNPNSQSLLNTLYSILVLYAIHRGKSFLQFLK